MTKSAKTWAIDCPSCATRIHFTRRPRLGAVIVCRECKESLEVVRLSPLQVDWPLLDESGWANGDAADYTDHYDRYTAYNWD